MNEAVIISDIHLGSEVCQAKKVRDFLGLIEQGQIATGEIVVNGDLFDSWDFRKLKGSHWKVLSQMRSLAKSKHIVWINGNHDGPAEIISHLIGVEFVEEYTLTSGDRKILIIHGDKFDNFISKYPLLTKLVDKAYRAIQRIDRSFYLARLAKRSSKTFMRCSDQIMHRAKSYGQRKGVDAVCCGHTHLAAQDLNGIHYHNSGCWTESPCHYLTVKDGSVRLASFP
jgi:UDP-2,3-diacylglucosamine pyrophosphatase LpxH